MTRALLVAVHDARLTAGVALAAYAFVALVLPVTMLFDALALLSRRRTVIRVLTASRAKCARGHAVDVGVGAFRCPTCGLVHEGHAFAQCPYCSTFAAAIYCPCGLPICNPLYRPGEP